MVSAYEWLEDPVLRDYRVPHEHAVVFLELQRKAEGIYRAHALEWSLWRARDSEEWMESGQFREDADRRAAADSFDQQPELLSSIARFETDPGNVIRSFVGRIPSDATAPREMVEQGTGAVWEVLFEIGHLPLPGESMAAIDPEDITPAMRLGRSLAQAIATRLSKIVPPPFAVHTDGEVLSLGDENGYGPTFSLVDIEPVEAVMEVLSGIQDDVTEELTVPWPHDAAQGYVEHRPDAEVRDSEIHAWYGRRDNPVLVLEPIPLSELKSS